MWRLNFCNPNQYANGVWGTTCLGIRPKLWTYWLLNTKIIDFKILDPTLLAFTGVTITLGPSPEPQQEVTRDRSYKDFTESILHYAIFSSILIGWKYIGSNQNAWKMA